MRSQDRLSRCARFLHSMKFFGHAKHLFPDIGVEPELQLLEAFQKGPLHTDNAAFLREHQNSQSSRDLESSRAGVSARVSVRRAAREVRMRAAERIHGAQGQTNAEKGSGKPVQFRGASECARPMIRPAHLHAGDGNRQRAASNRWIDPDSPICVEPNQILDFSVSDKYFLKLEGSYMTVIVFWTQQTVFQPVRHHDRGWNR